MINPTPNEALSQSRKVGKGAPAPCPPFSESNAFVEWWARFALPTLRPAIFQGISRWDGLSLCETFSLSRADRKMGFAVFNRANRSLFLTRSLVTK
jgi:hypothetical protein